jgi:hypothetical protein
MKQVDVVSVGSEDGADLEVGSPSSTPKWSRSRLSKWSDDSQRKYTMGKPGLLLGPVDRDVAMVISVRVLNGHLVGLWIVRWR